MVFWEDLWEPEDIDFYESAFDTPAADDIALQEMFRDAFVDIPTGEKIERLRDYLEDMYDVDLDDVFDWDEFREYYNETG